MRPLPPVEGRFSPGTGVGRGVSPLRPALLSRTPWGGAVRLVLRGRDVSGVKKAEDPPHCGSMSLRRAGMDWELSESGLAASVRRVRPGVRKALSLGALLYARQRNFRDRHFLGPVRLVERAAHLGPRLRYRAQEPCPGEPAGGGGRPVRPARRAVHPERIERILPPGGSGRAGQSGGPEPQALPLPRPFVRSRRAGRDVRVPDG